jgi:predicted MFS family arabinose efflux permease
MFRSVSFDIADAAITSHREHFVLLTRLSESLGVLHRREFRLLLSGQAVSVLGDRMVAVALAFAVLEVGGSISDVGLVLAAGVFPLVGSVLVGGVVADRASRRAVMVVADLVRVASQGTTAALLIAGVAEVWMLALLAGVTGMATGFFSPASTGLLPEVVLAEQLQPANALRSSAVSAGEILGPLAAGVLVAAAGAGWAIAGDAVTFGVSAACLLMLRMPARVAAHPSSFVADLREGWEAFRSRRWVWTVVVYFAFANILWGAWGTLGPVVADRDLGGAAAWGTVLAAMGVGALMGSLLATQVKPRRPLVFLAFADGLFALPLAFLAAAPPVPVLACGALLSGAGMMLAISVWESTLQRHIPGESLSRVSSYDWFGSLAFSPLGLAIWGPVAAAIGISISLWLAFGLSAAAILALLTVPDIRHMRVTPAPVSAPPTSPPGGLTR